MADSCLTLSQALSTVDYIAEVVDSCNAQQQHAASQRIICRASWLLALDRGCAVLAVGENYVEVVTVAQAQRS